MERDINFVFNKKYLVNEIISQIRISGKNLLEDINLIDIFNDHTFGDDFISYTFRLSYRDSDKTLVDSDISVIHEDIIKKIENNFNAKQRI